MFHRAITTTLVLSSLTFGSLARAGDAATAEVLFREGRALMEAGDYAAACPKLAESQAQDPATGTMLALAMCQEGAGQTASAWVTFAEVASLAKRDGRADREQMARERMAALEPTLSRLAITVDPAAASVTGLVVKRDGKDVGRGAWGTGVPVDPGEHSVEATAPGKRPWRAALTIGAQGDAQTVAVPALEDDVAAPGAAPGPLPATEPMDVGVSAADGPPLRTIGLVVGGAGIVGLGLGGFFALRAKGLNDESKEGGHCNAQNECDSAGGAKRDDAIGAANVATVAFIAGGVLTATGVTLFLVGGPKEKTAARVEATPAVGHGVAGLTVRGAF